MDIYSALRRQFEAEDGSFLSNIRSKLEWDRAAFKNLAKVMFQVARADSGKDHVEKWIAQGFWFCDTWTRSFSGHPSFSRPEKEQYEAALEILSDLAFYYFHGVCPYENDETLQRKIEEF